MARSVAERYLVATFAFMAAAVWFGVGLMGGFACLLVFVSALQVARLYQRRNDSRSRRARTRRERGYIYDPASTEAQKMSSSAERGQDGTRRPGRFYDVDREGHGWPMASEAT